MIAVIRCYFGTPFAPTGLRGNPGTGQITLNWTPVSGAGSYQVQQLIGSTWTILPRSPYTLTPTNPTGSATVGGLSHNTSYQHKVRAVGSNGKSTWTSPITTRTNRPTVTPALSFDDDITFQMFQVGAAVETRERSLPAVKVRGNVGTITYSLTPSLGHGLTFDPTSRSITGTPDEATATGTYTYTGTAGNLSASMELKVTVFDISLTAGAAQTSIENSKSLVYERVPVWISDTSHTNNDYQFSLGVPASTGFEANNIACTWPAPAATKMWTSWIPLDGSFNLLRCSIGAGGEANIGVTVRIEKNGPSYPVYDFDATIPTAWHRHDHEVAYYIKGTYYDQHMEEWKVNAIETETSEGFLPNGAAMPDHDVYDALLQFTTYSKAARPWNSILIDDPDSHVARKLDLEIERMNSDVETEVMIRGYWDTVESFGTDRECQGSIGCVKPLDGEGGYPHIGDGQVMYIEERPHWGDEEESRYWTVDYEEALLDDEMYQFLPLFLTHEFGHTIGLYEGPLHDINGVAFTDIMNGRGISSIEYTRATNALYGTDENAVKAIYDRHSANTPH